MRLSEFAEKRIINVYNGEILGSAGESDLLIDPDNGQILEIILNSTPRLMTRGDKHSFSIPWNSVKKIGPEIIVVDIDDNSLAHR